MPTTFTQTHEVDPIIKRVMEAYYPDLVEAGVTVDVLFASNPDESPLKSRGYPAAAVIKSQSLAQRAIGDSDVLLKIDFHQWRDFTEEQKTALVDHELHHLEVTRDDEEQIKRDDLDRPKLKMKVHTAEAGIFAEVIERHGRNALDVVAGEHVMGVIREALEKVKK